MFTSLFEWTLIYLCVSETPNQDNPSTIDEDRAFRENNVFGAKGNKGEDIAREAIDGEMTPDGAAIGGILAAVFSVIIILLISLIVFMLYRRRCKTPGSPQGVRTVIKRDTSGNGSLPRSSDNGIHIEMLPRKESPLPDVLRHKRRDSDKWVPANVLPSNHVPIMNGHVVHDGRGIADGLSNRESVEIQQLHTLNPNPEATAAWNEMLQQAAYESEIEDPNGNDERLNPHMTVYDSPENELPPPPAFLLDNNPGDVSDVSYHDIIEGYCSGDNVEDTDTDVHDTDICEPEYEIRIPSPGAIYYDQYAQNT